MTKTNSLSLNAQIIIALVVGILVGALLNVSGVAEAHPEWISNSFQLVGKLFINALKMLVLPVVIVSLICGASSLSDPSRLGRLGGKTIFYYLITTAVAISLALSAGILFRPGEGVERSFEAANIAAAPAISEVFLRLIPRNIVEAMHQENMLGIIIFSLILGVAITLSGEAGKRVGAFFNDLNEVIMKFVSVIMKAAPYGVFALMVQLGATTGLEVFSRLALYVFLVLAVLGIHVSLTYPMLVRFAGGLDPRIFLRKMRPVMLFAFSTASSNATIPVNLRNITERLGVHNNIASFTIPLGATINMDGTAIMQGLATTFIAQAYGIDLSATQYLTVIMMVILASVGAAGVPGVGLILLATVLQQVNLPAEAIGMILGVDRILDMARTAVNVTGDAAVSLVVAQTEGELDLETYLRPDEDDGGSGSGEGILAQGIH